MSRRRQRVLGEVALDRRDGGGVAESTRRNLRAIRSTIFGVTKNRGTVSKQDGTPVSKQDGTPVSTPGASSGETKEQEVDPFVRLERSGKILRPPFDPLLLAVIPENSTEIGPCIDAMAVNCDAFGWRLEPRIPISESTPIEILQTLAEERVRAENFFAAACQDENAFDDLRDKLRRDFEATGMFYVEFLEVPGAGDLDGINHLPAWTMRLGRLDHERTEYIAKRVEKEVRLVELEPELEPEAPDLEEPGEVEGRTPIRKRRYEEQISYRIVEETRWKRFRRYVQKHEGKTTWFKELGDPRLVDCRSGEVVDREKLAENHGDGAKVEPRFTLDGDAIVVAEGTSGFPVRLAANPVKHLDLYSTRSSYGLPRYIGDLFSIFGSRAADEINYVTFKNQNIPNLVVTVSNGQLTEESADRIEEFIESIQSDDNYSKILLLEAEPVMEGMRDPGTVRIELKPLTKEQHSDALFVNYQNNNDERTRRAWRFPPIFVGKSEDFTGKTIDASRRLGDEQVFGPERHRFDRFWTRWVLVEGLGIVWSTFRSNSPDVAENADLVKLMAQGEKTGGLTPRIARKIIGRVVNEDLGDVDVEDEGFDPDAPFSWSLAKLMKSDAASAAVGGGEPTSQGRSGLQVGGGDRDRDAEGGTFEEDAVERLAGMLRAEVAARFGGFVPSSFVEDDLEEDEE